jgi:hypothetical protein
MTSPQSFVLRWLVMLRRPIDRQAISLSSGGSLATGAAVTQVVPG